MLLTYSFKTSLLSCLQCVDNIIYNKTRLIVYVDHVLAHCQLLILSHLFTRTLPLESQNGFHARFHGISNWYISDLAMPYYIPQSHLMHL